MGSSIKKKVKKTSFVFLGSVVVVITIGIYFVCKDNSVEYNSAEYNIEDFVAVEQVEDDNIIKTLFVLNEEPKKSVFVATHVGIPEAVKTIYMTACVAGTPSFRNKLVKLVDETELNSIIIDIKDYTGTVSFDLPEVFPPEKAGESLGEGCRVKDMKEFIQILHEKGIYVIGRITVFQDPYYTKYYPEVAVKKLSDKTTWTDYKGISFVDVGAKSYWDYIVDISKLSYEAGFDELNYDYIRFPSDGNMSDTYYPFSEERVLEDPDFGKAKTVQEFFKHLYEEMKDTGVVTSADLFGMVTTNSDDLNIGQVLEYAIPYFDFVAPMVYPSHYPKGFMGYQKVNDYPYEIVKYSMEQGVKKIEEMNLATTTDWGGRGVYDSLQLRPWLQDFNYPVTYTSEMVRTQIQATYDAGLASWMLWDAGNTYTREALLEVW